jgi:hypothetical protein
MSDRLGVSERLACRVIEQPRSTQVVSPSGPAMRRRCRARCGGSLRSSRWGYRRAHHALRAQAWGVKPHSGSAHMAREGVAVPHRRRKGRRLGESTVPAQRLRAERPNQVWALEYQHDQNADGRGCQARRWHRPWPDVRRSQLGSRLGRSHTSFAERVEQGRSMYLHTASLGLRPTALADEPRLVGAGRLD